MLGVVMYWTAIVIEPTNEIAKDSNDILKKIDIILVRGIIQQNITQQYVEKIIENQNNNTAQLKAYINLTEEIRQEQTEFLYYILNQSNIIGNQTAELILDNINHTNEIGNKTSQLILSGINYTNKLQANISEEHSRNSLFVSKNFSEVLQTLDIDLAGINKTLENLANTDNSGRDRGFMVSPISFSIGNLTDTGANKIQLKNESGRISGFLGGPSINLVQDNETGKISGFLGGAMIVNQTIPSITAMIIDKAQNKTS